MSPEAVPAEVRRDYEFCLEHEIHRGNLSRAAAREALLDFMMWQEDQNGELVDLEE